MPNNAALTDAHRDVIESAIALLSDHPKNWKLVSRLRAVLAAHPVQPVADDATGPQHLASSDPEAHRQAITDYGADCAAAPGAVQTGDRLTDMKANDIIARDGFKLTGAVLRRDDGARCIVELSAVRWLTKDDMWALMHPVEQESRAENSAPLSLATGVGLNAIGDFYMTPRNDGEPDVPYRERIQVVKAEFEAWLRTKRVTCT